MRIILVQAEIELAIRAYVLTQIAVKEGQDISIDFKNTRGDDGTTAEINITSPTMTAAPAKTEAPNEQPEKPAQTATQSRQPAPAKQIAAKTSTAALAPAAAAGATTGSQTKQSASNASTTTAQPEPEASTSETTTTEAQQTEESSGFPERTVPFDAKDPVDGGDTPVVTEMIKPVSKPSFLQTPAAATDAAPVAGSGKSLFANLTKPVNPKPPAEG